MKGNYTIKNFRIFGSQGETFEFSPITILTGCNSCGKSSLAKSLLVFNKFLSKVKEGVRTDKCTIFDYTLDITTNEYNLGNFELVQNNQSDPIIFEYAIQCDLFPKTVHVTYEFVRNEDSSVSNGKLSRLTVIDEDGNCILNLTSSNKFGSSNKVNIAPLKTFFSHFCYALGQKNLTNGLSSYQIMGAESGYTMKQIEQMSATLEEVRKVISENPAMQSFVNYLKSGMDEDLRGINPGNFLRYEDYNSVYMVSSIATCCKAKTKLEAIQILSKFYSETGDDEIKKLSEMFEASSYESFAKFWTNFEDSYLLSDCLDMSVINLKKNLFAGISDSLSRDHGFFNEVSEYKICDGFLLHSLYRLSEEYKEDNSHTMLSIGSKIYNDFEKYYLKVLKMILLPDFTDNLLYHSSERASVKRLYDYMETNEMSFGSLLLKYATNMRKSYSSFTPGDFINKWMKRFKIADSLELKNTDEGFGLMMYLRKGEIRRLLADEGYGITQLVSTLIAIELGIMQSSSGDKAKTIIIEEPEIHLHPSYQSLLADMFIDAYLSYGIEFIIETHSEYLIRRIQVLYAKSQKKVGDSLDLPENFATVYYISSDIDEASPEEVVKKITIKPDGRLSAPFGRGFFDEADNLAFELLLYK